ncbi:MAG TPA: response regulator [Candidatus Sulfotelmatobacter sp.]|nr:response regulator [Candidatus Sulfotelmatobacter sp.]
MARKILLADDSVTAQNMGRKILADAGYEVTTVNNGSAALKRINEQRPDLIILDVYMPGYSGLEVCQRLKETGETSRIPVLLTVGKLEPFKPEEAKRVRADGFIIKPFEASELLSALSKLEDKIVPRPESSKPGRLARAAAALEEVPRDKTDEDSGWKNRISFPSKNKEKPEAADDSAIYNPVNRDLRTVIEARPVAEAKPEGPKVDLGAVAPEGLPKDVTPEEIAALAAAAAQVQGKVLGAKAEEPAQSKIEEVKRETKPENREVEREAQPAESVAEPVTAAAAIPAAVEAVQEKVETSTVEDAPKEAPPMSAPTDAITVAVAEVKQESEKKETDSAREARDAEPADVPVTMAVAAAADSGKSHWTAVAVGLAPEDTGISLEEEMQRARAVYAVPAAEIPSAQSSAPIAEPVEATAAATAPAPEASSPVASGATQTLSEIAAVATDTVRAAVKEFETVAAAYVSESQSAQSYVSPAAGASESPAVEPASAVDKEAEPVSVGTEETTNIEAQAQQPAPETLKPETESKISEAAGSVPEVEAPVAQAGAEQNSSAQDSGGLSKPSRETGGHEGDNLAATTAAAWASWRRIRESNSPADSSDSAAMAVAAGAEKSPEDVSGDESDPAIASIVDSVLADLRPKIVEEISRKLGKKK